MVTKIVSDIVRKKIFSGQMGVMFDETRFGGRFANVVTEVEKPVTCTADFRPMLAFNKSFLAQIKADPSAEKEPADKLATRVTYTVKPTDAGGVYVEVTDGLDAFD